MAVNEGDEKPTVISAQSARQGVISGRVILVLAISMVLAVIAMFVILSYFYTTHGAPGT